MSDLINGIDPGNLIFTQYRIQMLFYKHSYPIHMNTCTALMGGGTGRGASAQTCLS